MISHRGFKNIGYVKEVKDGIVFADGLSLVGYNELVLIKNMSGSVQGLALNLDDKLVGIIVLGSFTDIKEGGIVEATGEVLSIKVDENIIGKVVDPLGRIVDSESDVCCPKGKEIPIERVAPGVIERQNVDRPLLAGTLAIDATIPVGRGQRELIIGDRQTGKTTLCLDAIINQKGKNVKCVYTSIGQKVSKLASIKNLLEEAGALEYTTIMTATSSDPASMQYLAPYSATAIAEYFAQKGEDVLVIYDDLTKHAWAYREISLLLRRPPGREAYPGDIFYIHSRLLERSLQYSKEKGGGSITSLPIIETQQGDISAYIPTNVISITDGQLFLDKDMFNSGQRPAINLGASVSRVGGDAQLKPMKQVAGKLKLELAQYRELQAFAQFGSDLDNETKKKLDRGARMMSIMRQPQNNPLDVSSQIIKILSVSTGALDNYELIKIPFLIEKIIEKAKTAVKLISKALSENKKLTDEELEEIRKDIISVLPEPPEVAHNG